MAGGHSLLLFAKEPRPGLVKTRLAADVGAARALELAHSFLVDVVLNARAVEGVRRTIWFAPDDGASYFRALDPDAALEAQPDLDFGARLSFAFASAFASGSGRAVMIGMDSPQIPSTRIEEAFEALGRDDLVLGPSLDGGYYLIGLRRGADHAALFDRVPWSGPEVLDVTRRAAERAGPRLALLEPELDVDDGADLDALRKLLAARPRAAPRTRAALGL